MTPVASGSLLQAGDIVTVNVDPAIGRVQGGTRPAVVVSSRNYRRIPDLFLAVPLTKRDRRLEHHIAVPADGRTGLDRLSFALTEQVQTVSYEQPGRLIGETGAAQFYEICDHVHWFIATQAASGRD